MLSCKFTNAQRAELSDDKFRVHAKATEDGPVELTIYEEIGQDVFGGGVSAEQVVDFLRKYQDRDVNLHINSPGGLVYDGVAIYNALKMHDARVVAYVDGLAFSAASFIPMAADRVIMHEMSTLGIHRSWGMAIGNRNEMEATAEILTHIDNQLIGVYAARTGKDRKWIEDKLDGKSDGTVFSAAEAVEYGFADEIIANVAAETPDTAAAATMWHELHAAAKGRLAAIQARQAARQRIDRRREKV